MFINFIFFMVYNNINFIILLRYEILRISSLMVLLFFIHFQIVLHLIVALFENSIQNF